jgi:voltage-gated potassium channel
MRDRYNAFIERHDVAWELVMAFLAVMYVAVGFALDDPADSIQQTWLLPAEVALTIVFVLEFATRLLAARDRPAYLRIHWIDAIALIPVARGLRALRTLRLLRLVRAFASVYRVLGHVESLARHRGLQIVIVSWLAVMVICCLALFLAERDVNPNLRTPFDALWWGISTMTTVGYGDVYPMTGEGRVVASALMLLGIGLFSAVTAIITSVFLSVGRPQADPVATIERLAAAANAGSITQEQFALKRAELLARI